MTLLIWTALNESIHCSKIVETNSDPEHNPFYWRTRQNPLTEFRNDTAEEQRQGNKGSLEVLGGKSPQGIFGQSTVTKR